MPQLTFPITKDGLSLDTVLIGLDGKSMTALRAAGLPLPAPIHARGRIDTGTDLTAVDPRVLQQVGSSPVRSASTQTASGLVKVKVFEVSLSIWGPQGIKGPALDQANLLVTELATSLPGVDVLIGMDVLSHCLLVVNGPGGQFILAF